MRYYEIAEARRNPEQNPKHTVYDQIKDYLTDPNSYVTFTTINKVGINPKSRYQTPNGIYTYNLAQSVEYYNITDIEASGLFSKFPFASAAPMFWILKPVRPDRILHLTDEKYTNDNLEKDIYVLKQYFLETYPRADEQEYDEFIHAAKETTRHKTSSGYIWNITRCASANWNPDTTKTNANKWNHILRVVLGYDGAQDDNAIGIIHPSEKLQTVFFYKGAVDVVKRVENVVDSRETKQFKLEEWLDAIEYESFSLDGYRYCIDNIMSVGTMSEAMALEQGFSHMTEELITTVLTEDPTNDTFSAPFKLKLIKLVEKNKEPLHVYVSFYELTRMLNNQHQAIVAVAIEALVQNAKSFGKMLERAWSTLSSMATSMIADYIKNNQQSKPVQTVLQSVSTKFINTTLKQIHPEINAVNGPLELNWPDDDSW